ncbi:hypothetical protein FLX56_17395 [Synechococcus moorigangaii CMS01]|nr:hypothetical protein [Synechococcus moorigangaii CMS01]
MKLVNGTIAHEKPINSLLKFQVKNDKSKFLAQAGFTQENLEQFKQAILNLPRDNEAIQERVDKYGTSYRVEGQLQGVYGKLEVVSIWQQQAIDP